MRQAQEFLQRIVLLFTSGAILAFFSEFYFMNEGPVFSLIDAVDTGFWASLSNLAGLTAFYAIVSAAPLLLAINGFYITSIASLFLAAVLYGWATEGLVVPLIYMEGWIWPSISWHAPIDVMVGWFGLRWLLGKNNALLSALSMVGLGVFWAYWATWITPEGGSPLGADKFTNLAFVSSALLFFGFVFWDRVAGMRYRPTRLETILLCLVFAALMAMHAIAFPVQVGLTVLFVAGILGLLWLDKRRRVSTKTPSIAQSGDLTASERPVEATILDRFQTKISGLNLLFIWLMPLAAALSYPLISEAGIIADLGLIAGLLTLISLLTMAYAAGYILFKALKTRLKR